MNRTSIATFLLFFALYLWTGAPSSTWFDTGELAVAAFTLGNGHPPGQPLFAILGRAATLLPVAAIPFRLSLLSALCGALAAALLPFLLRSVAALAGRPAPRAMISSVLLPGVALALPLWLQAVRIELYALHLCLVLLALELALRYRRVRSTGIFLALCLLLGLALANHHLLVVLSMPALALVTGWPGRRRLAAGCAALLLGLGTWLQLPLRSRSGAMLDWGHPGDLEHFLTVVTARAYQKSFVHLTLERLVANLEAHGALFLSILGGGMLVLSLGGLLALRRAPRALLALLLLLGGNVAATALQSVFFPENPDALGYLGLSFVVLALLAALGLEAGLESLEARLEPGPMRRLAAWGGGLTAAGLALVPALRAWPGPDLHDAWTAHRFSQLLLKDLPPGALYLAGSDASTFGAWYQQVIEGARPDVEVLSVYTVGGVGPMRGTPALPSIEGSDRTGARQIRRLIELERARRPVELTAADLPLRMADRMRVGATRLWITDGSARSPLTAGLEGLEVFWEAETARLLADPAYLRDRQARMLFPKHLEALGDHFLELGMLEAALRMFRPAERLDPDPTRLVRLKRSRLEQRIGALPRPPAGPEEAGSSEAWRLKQAEHALMLGRAADAKSWLEGLSREEPALLLARARLARLEGDTAAVARHLEQLHRVAPVGAEAVAALAELEPLLPDAMAEAWLREALWATRDARLAAALAMRRLMAGEVALAGELADAAVRQAPELLEPLVARGWALVEQDRLLEARGVLQEALRLDPVAPSALRLASFLYRQGVR